MLIVRDIARTNARISWPLYSRSKQGYVSQSGEINGITTGEFAAYYIVWTLVRNMNVVFGGPYWEWRIREGYLSGQLLRPLHPLHYDIAWFAGRWVGSGLGGETEETWSAPAGGAMMGMFRLVKGGTVVFYEFLTLVEREGSLLLKLKHFNADLTGWEEKGAFVTFRLIETTPAELRFDGLTFRRIAPDRVDIFLALRNRQDGTVREEAFSMIRTRASD